MRKDKKATVWTLGADIPPKSSGAASGKLIANGARPQAVDFYKNLTPDFEEPFVRYYAGDTGESPAVFQSR